MMKTLLYSLERWWQQYHCQCAASFEPTELVDKHWSTYPGKINDNLKVLYLHVVCHQDHVEGVWIHGTWFFCLCTRYKQSVLQSGCYWRQDHHDTCKYFYGGNLNVPQRTLHGKNRLARFLIAFGYIKSRMLNACTQCADSPFKSFQLDLLAEDLKKLVQRLRMFYVTKDFFLTCLHWRTLSHSNTAVNSCMHDNCSYCSTEATCRCLNVI